MYLPVIEGDLSPLNPLVWAFGISLICSGAGVSGAFLLLPYQFTVLGYILPGVSATNQIFNILACPAGIWRFAKEGRLILPLAKIIVFGSIPGVILGAYARAGIFQGIAQFRIFVAFILLYLGLRLIIKNSKKAEKSSWTRQAAQVQSDIYKGNLRLEWNGQRWTLSARKIFYASLITGLAGGIYGVGGGALLSPILVSYFQLPLYLLAGATLFGTFITSLFGLGSYIFIAYFLEMPQMFPDITLGLLLGLGGIPGMYCGAALQKYIGHKYLKMLLAVVILCTASFYFIQTFSHIFN